MKKQDGLPRASASRRAGGGVSGVKPILFSGPMVRAILDGKKTQTRRICKFVPREEGLDFGATSLKAGLYHTGCPNGAWVLRSMGGSCWNDRTHPLRCPYGAPGDRLWVREKLIRPNGSLWLYDADNQPVMVAKADETAMLVWAHHKEQDYCTSMFMPRWASRLTLEITAIRVERLQEISGDDVLAEGVDLVWGNRQTLGTDEGRARALLYGQLWDEINGKRPGCAWADNPWVWCVTFRRAPTPPLSGREPQD